MKDYRRGAHTTFEIHLHLVWVTKYRKPVLTGEVGLRVRELIREICGNHEVTIMKGHISIRPCASVREYPAAGDNQPFAPDVEREKFLQADA